MREATVVGAGLAGAEAAWQLAERGVRVTLLDQKPARMTPAHQNADFAELVCSNSLKAERLESASGLLKQEMRRLGSLVMRCADVARVPAGGALAVDREKFAGEVTASLKGHGNIACVCETVESIPEGPCVIATGPLTEGGLFEAVARLTGKENLYFFDAASPIVTAESVDKSLAFSASRYGRGEDDYLNCPLDEDEYFALVRELQTGNGVELKDFEDARVFESCMPIEVMARRGEMTLAFGPLKPIGLIDPRTNKRPFAVAQLRREDAQGRLYNLVGFQTNLTFGEQKRIFSLIPALHGAEFVRFGVMHRNTYLRAPGFLNVDFSVKGDERLAFAGQMTGVEGYMESAASGLLAGLSLARRLEGNELPPLPEETAMGSLARYVSSWANADYQPMNIHFGLLPPLLERVRSKPERCRRIARRALDALEIFCHANDIFITL